MLFVRVTSTHHRVIGEFWTQDIGSSVSRF